MYSLSGINIYTVRLLKENLSSNFSWFSHYRLTWEDGEGKKENDKQTRKVLLPDASIQGQVLGKCMPSSE